MVVDTVYRREPVMPSRFGNNATGFET